MGAMKEKNGIRSAIMTVLVEIDGDLKWKGQGGLD